MAIHTEFIPNGKTHFHYYKDNYRAYTACGMPANFAEVKNLNRVPFAVEDVMEVDCGRCKASKQFQEEIKKQALARLLGTKENINA